MGPRLCQDTKLRHIFRSGCSQKYHPRKTGRLLFSFSGRGLSWKTRQTFWNFLKPWPQPRTAVQSQGAPKRTLASSRFRLILSIFTRQTCFFTVPGKISVGHGSGKGLGQNLWQLHEHFCRTCRIVPPWFYWRSHNFLQTQEKRSWLRKTMEISAQSESQRVRHVCIIKCRVRHKNEWNWYSTGTLLHSPQRNISSLQK